MTNLRSNPPNPPRVHGGMDCERLRAMGIDPMEAIDFSVSINSYGPCPAVVDAMAAAVMDRYPDPMDFRARSAVATALDVDARQVLLGNGAAELLWTVAHAFLRGSQTRLLTVEPTFSEMRVAANALGAETVPYTVSADDGFQLRLDDLSHVVSCSQPDVVYLCSPNSPTGTCVRAAALAALLADHPRVHWVIDQSFLSLSDYDADAHVGLPANAIVVRSLTKDYGVPGARMGYLVATTRLVERFMALRPTWSVGAHVQAGICAAMASSFVSETRPRILADRAYLSAGLFELGLSPLPSTTAFVSVDVGDGRAIQEALISRHQLWVRDCASFGLPRHIRIAARPRGDSDRLLAALGECCVRSSNDAA